MAALGLCCCTRAFLFIYLWLRWVSVAARGLSLAVVSWGYSSLWYAGFSLRRLLLLWSMGSRVHRLQELWRMGLVAPRHVGSPRTRAGTRVSCIGRQILKHCATSEVQVPDFLKARDSFSLPSFPGPFQWFCKHLIFLNFLFYIGV